MTPDAVMERYVQMSIYVVQDIARGERGTKRSMSEEGVKKKKKNREKDGPALNARVYTMPATASIILRLKTFSYTRRVLKTNSRACIRRRFRKPAGAFLDHELQKPVVLLATVSAAS